MLKGLSACNDYFFRCRWLQLLNPRVSCLTLSLRLCPLRCIFSLAAILQTFGHRRQTIKRCLLIILDVLGESLFAYLCLLEWVKVLQTLLQVPSAHLTRSVIFTTRVTHTVLGVSRFREKNTVTNISPCRFSNPEFDIVTFLSCRFNISWFFISLLSGGTSYFKGLSLFRSS